MTTNSSSAGPTRPYACINCTQRKVKCNKCHPCAACSRSRLLCRYSNTPPSRQRRKRKAGSDQTDGLSETLLERLRSHEAALLNAGIPFQSFDEGHGAAAKDDAGTFDNGAIQSLPNTFYQRDDSFQATQRHQDSRPISSSPGLPNAVERLQTQPEFPTRQAIEGEPQQQHQQPHRGVLLSEDGGKRYYEHGFIGVMGQEYRQQPICSPSNDSVSSQGVAYHWSSQNAGSNTITESILTPGMAHPQLGPQSPNQLQLAAHVTGPLTQHWFTFLENVHPLTKVVHAPSVEVLMLSNNNSVEELSSTSSMTSDALKYSICACAISSLTDRECKAVFGEAHFALLHAFQSATRHALSEASFLRVPDIDLLCAHVLLLTSMFHNSDRYSLWTVMGSTIRMAQSQGLHRDGASLELSPFKVEMRRRLWWYIVSLDQRLSELVGAESCLPQSTDTMLPCNCNDADLKPDMTEAPTERSGATEMTFCKAKYEIVRYLYERGSISSLDRKSGEGEGKGDGDTGSNNSGSGSLKRSLTDLKSFLEENYLRFCDPVVPVQFLATMVTRSTICKLMQMALHRIARPPDIRPPANAAAPIATSGQPQPATPTNEPFQLASRNLEYDNLIHSSRSLRGFLWYVRFFIPWGAPVYVLKTLAGRGDWDQAMQSAWSQIEELYEHHYEYIESDTDIHLLIGELTLQAWAARENFLKTVAESGMNAKWSSTLPQMVPVLHQKHRLRQQQQQQQQRHQHQHHSQQSLNKYCNIPNDGPYLGDFSNLDPLLSCLPDFIDPLFVPGEWANWTS